MIDGHRAAADSVLGLSVLTIVTPALVTAGAPVWVAVCGGVVAALGAMGASLWLWPPAGPGAPGYDRERGPDGGQR